MYTVYTQVPEKCSEVLKKDLSNGAQIAFSRIALLREETTTLQVLGRSKDICFT